MPLDDAPDALPLGAEPLLEGDILLPDAGEGELLGWLRGTVIFVVLVEVDGAGDGLLGIADGGGFTTVVDEVGVVAAEWLLLTLNPIAIAAMITIKTMTIVPHAIPELVGVPGSFGTVLIIFSS